MNLKILQLETIERKAKGKKKIGKLRPQYIKIGLLNSKGKTETYLLNKSMDFQRMQKVKEPHFPLAIKKMIFQLNLEPGLYLLEISFVESSFADFCIILFDEKEIGCFGVPNYRMDGNRCHDLRCNTFPFICSSTGTHKLEIMTTGQMGGEYQTTE